MADASIECIDDFDFHPANSPRGMVFYDLSILPNDARTRLNQLKMKTRKDNEIYLKKHPEVRGLIVIILKEVLRRKPRKKIQEMVYNYLLRYRSDVADAMDEYVQIFRLKSTQPTQIVEETLQLSKKEVKVDHVDVSAGLLEKFDEESIEDVPYSVLKEIIESALDRLKIDVNEDSTETYIKELIHEEMNNKLDNKYETEVRMFIEDEIIKQVLVNESESDSDETIEKRRSESAIQEENKSTATDENGNLMQEASISGSVTLFTE